MAYIGNQPFTTAFLTDQFSGNGSTTAFTLSAAPANTNSLLVAVTGVLQDPSTYSVSGTTLTFSAAPPSGTGNISVRFLGIPASGVVTTAYRTLTEFTATAGQTTFTPPSYTVGYINVFRNGVMLGTADYTASNGTTVVLVNAATAGDLVAIESFYVSSVLNALPTSGGTLSGALIVPNFTYTGTLTGSTSVLNIGSGQIYKDASGNVGIGTSSPSTKLHVQGNARSANSGNTVYTELQNDGVYATGTDLYLLAPSGKFLAMYAGNAERARIDSSGNLLVGTTSGPTNARFVARHSVSNAGVAFVQGGSTSYTDSVFTVSSDTASGTGFNLLRLQNAGGNCLLALGNGNVQNTNNSYGGISDAKLKENVVDATPKLDKLTQVRVVNYNLIGETQKQLGVIAQELEPIFPGMVEETPDRDEEGNDLGTTTKSVKYSVFVPMLIKAVQELTAKLDAAEARIAALENKA